MTPILRDSLMFIGAAIAAQIQIGPLFGLMIVAGGAIVALTMLGVLLSGAVALDHFVVRPSGIGGWLLTASALGLCANVAFHAVTSDFGEA